MNTIVQTKHKNIIHASLHTCVCMKMYTYTHNVVFSHMIHCSVHVCMLPALGHVLHVQEILYVVVVYMSVT